MPESHEVVGAEQLCVSMDGPLPLSGSVKELPPFFLECLLPSEELNTLHENNVFSFVMTYLDQHMQHMTRHSIRRVNSNHPQMRQRLGLLVSVTHRTSIPDRCGTATGDMMGTSTHVCSFSLSDDLLPLQPGDGVSRWTGLSFEYPVMLTLTRSVDGGSLHVDVALRFVGAQYDSDRLLVSMRLRYTGWRAWIARKRVRRGVCTVCRV